MAEQRAGEGGEEGLGAAGVGGAGVPGSTALRGHLACQAFPGGRKVAPGGLGGGGGMQCQCCNEQSAQLEIGLCWIMCTLCSLDTA